MSTPLRITLEVAGAVAFVTLVGCSMISVPQDVLMDHYVRWLRLPVAFVITFCAIAQVLQTSEPLPPWAIFTKFAGSRSLVFCGIISYGLYLVHWVLIVWYGDPEINTMRARQPGMIGRDIAIGAASIIISTASFWLFEKPLLQLSAKAPAGRVIASGMVSMGCVAMLVLAATRGCTLPSSTYQIPGVRSSEASSDKLGPESTDYVPLRLMFIGDSQADRLGRLMKETTNEDRGLCPARFSEPWGPKVINYGKPQTCVIQTFGSERCSKCWTPTTSVSVVSTDTSDTIAKEQAPYVFVIDSNWFKGWEVQKEGNLVERGLWGMDDFLVEAAQRMIRHLAVNGARHIFLSTSSPFILYKNHSQGFTGALLQRDKFLTALQGMRCSSSTDAGLRLLVSVVHYHKLVCPEWDDRWAEHYSKAGKKVKCDQSGPGFQKKMDPSGFHPNREEGGRWLVRQLRKVLFHGIARQGAHYAKPFEVPLLCRTDNCSFQKKDAKYLQDCQAHTPVEELLSTTEICVAQSQANQMSLQHQRAKVDMVKGAKDVYMCRGFKLEGLPSGAGITSLSVIKDPETWHRIHHILLFSCDPSFAPPASFENSFPCTHQAFMQGCSRIVMTFGGAHAANEISLPDGIAFRILSKYALVQVHYKRPHTQQDGMFFDSTGVSINLGIAPQAAQLFELGPRDELSIPPRSSRHVVQSICAPDCLSDAMEENAATEFKIIAVQQHMHVAGIAVKSEVLHANGSSTPFGVFPSYNMSEQDMKLLSSEVVVSRGDALKVTCVYDSSQRARWTWNGISLADEMCFSYILMTQAPLYFSRCWHLGGVNRAQSDECSSECSKPFSIQPTRHFKGPEAAAAEHDVFSATGACLK